VETLAEIKAVLFDFGETLASLKPAKEELFISAARSIGLELLFSAVQRAYQIVDFHNKYSSVHVKNRADFYREYNEQLCWALGIRSHFEQLEPALASAFNEHKSWQLVDGVPEVLAALKQRGIRLAIVANWDRDLPALAERLGISHFFSTIVSSQEAGVEKPDPAIFARAVQELSLSTERDTILYVGNEYKADVYGSRAAGLVPILIDRYDLYPHADCLRFTSLLQWIEIAK
jgi:putative hydrolase of the HAD superfamily